MAVVSRNRSIWKFVVLNLDSRSGRSDTIVTGHMAPFFSHLISGVL
jgi:hypothetical protein